MEPEYYSTSLGPKGETAYLNEGRTDLWVANYRINKYPEVTMEKNRVGQTDSAMIREERRKLYLGQGGRARDEIKQSDSPLGTRRRGGQKTGQCTYPGMCLGYSKILREISHIGVLRTHLQEQDAGGSFPPFRV